MQLVVRSGQDAHVSGGLRFVNSGFFHLFLQNITRLLVEDIEVTSPVNSANTDGIDPLNCTYVHIRNVSPTPATVLPCHTAAPFSLWFSLAFSARACCVYSQLIPLARPCCRPCCCSTTCSRASDREINLGHAQTHSCFDAGLGHRGALGHRRRGRRRHRTQRHNEACPNRRRSLGAEDARSRLLVQCEQRHHPKLRHRMGSVHQIARGQAVVEHKHSAGKRHSSFPKHHGHVRPVCDWRQHGLPAASLQRAAVRSLPVFAGTTSPPTPH